MTDVLKLGKRTFTVAVALATIFWSVGISAFVLPSNASAASAGDVIKGTTLSTLYYYAADGSRYAFPNEKTYYTWYSDFSSVKTITDSELAAIPLAGNIVYRPGSRWIKIQSDPKTYAVTPQGQIRWIESESVAQGLAGSDWNAFIDDVSDTFFVDYTVGTSLMDAGDAYNGALVKMSDKKYLVWNGVKREVTSSGWSGNRYQDRVLLDGTSIDLAGVTSGSSVSGQESVLVDVAQLGEEVTGGLSVSLASDTPASATVPADAASVPFTKIKFTATSGSASIDQLVFKLGGVGAVGNLGNVYLYDDGTRLTDGRSVNSSTREVTFSALNIDLSSGESKYLTVRADIAAAPNGGDTASFYLSSESSVSSSATVSGNFSISGNTMTFSETQAGTIVVDKTGTISDPTIGEEGAVIAKFTVEAQDEAASIERITVRVDDAPDHSNYDLWQSDTLLAAGEQSGDLVAFILTNPLELAEGKSATLKVTADIGGQANDTVHVAIEEEADILAIGGDYGFNMSADITGYDETGSSCASSADDCSYGTIIGGELTFAFNGPASDDVQIDGDDQVFMEFSITAQNWTDLKELAVIIACEDGSASGCDADPVADDGDLYNDGADEPNLQDITIRETDGTTWMGPEEYDDTSDITHTLTFSDDQILQTGETLDLMITADISTDAIQGDIYSMTLDMSAIVAEDANGDELSTADDIVPSSDIGGNNFTLTDASLTVDLAEPPSSGTYVKGANNVDTVGFSFVAGGASDLTVTEVKYTAMGDNDGAFTDLDGDIDVGDHVSSCSVYDSESGALVDGPESLNSDDEVTFSDFDWSVEAGETSKMVLRCNYSNQDTESATDDAYAFYIAAAGDITAEDADGDQIDPTLSDDNSDGAVAIVIASTGDLDITLDGSTAKSTIILGSSTGVSMAKYKFDATDEAFTVKKLTLRNCVAAAADADDDCADGGEADGSDSIASAVKISYLDKAGATQTKTGFISGGKVVFDNLDFYVPTDSTRTLSVTADTATVSSTGAASGSSIQLNLDAESTGAIGDFEAIGAGSGETLTEDDVDTYVVANDMVARKTKPTISLASGSPSGASVPGLSEVFRFNVSADSRGYVALNAITFKVTSTDGGAGDWNICSALGSATKWEFYDNADPSTKLDDATDWFFLDNTTDDDACTAAQDLKYAILDLATSATTPVEEIGAGETKTYVLRIDTTGASSTDDDSIRIDIIDETEADGLVEDCVAGGAPDCASYDDDDNDLQAIAWDDDVEADNVNGDFVKNLPVTGGTIVY